MFSNVLNVLKCTDPGSDRPLEAGGGKYGEFFCNNLFSLHHVCFCCAQMLCRALNELYGVI
jgi:hypothetical protein